MASYEKRNGVWTVRYRENTPEGMLHYKRLCGKFKTKKEAIAAYEDYVASRATTEKAGDEPANMLFSELVDNYIAYQGMRTKSTTLYHELSRIRSHILPFFQDYMVSDISPIDIQNWQQSLRQYSYKYQKGLYQELHHIISYGAKTFKLYNVMTESEPPRNLSAKKEMKIWTPDQFNTFIEHVTDPVYNLFYRFLYLTGCRRGEAIALGWEDIDFENCTVKIGKAYSGHPASGIEISTPKNESSYRTIGIPDKLVSSLADHHKTSKGKFVFGGDQTLPAETIRRIMIHAAEEAKVPVIRVHDLRHSHASFLLSSGVPVTAVSKRLGHSSVTQTYNTYSHIMPQDHALIGSLLDGI